MAVSKKLLYLRFIIPARIVKTSTNINLLCSPLRELVFISCRNITNPQGLHNTKILKLNTMTKFNPENKDILTYGECLAPAMEITDQEDADQYFADYLKYQSKFQNENYTPEQVCRENLGYYAGYGTYSIQGSENGELQTAVKERVKKLRHGFTTKGVTELLREAKEYVKRFKGDNSK